MRNRSKPRLVNGVLSAFVAVFFFAHSLLGGLEPFAQITSPPVFVMWMGVGIVGAHVIASVITSREQLTDASFPPSKRKKRHLALKWATGIALAAAIGTHIACIRSFGPEATQVSATSALVVLLLVTALVVHIWVGAKSLMTDLGLSKSFILPFRIAACVLALAIGCIVLAGSAWWH